MIRRLSLLYCFCGWYKRKTGRNPRFVKIKNQPLKKFMNKSLLPIYSEEALLSCFVERLFVWASTN